MTITVDTLIANTQSISSTAYANVLALKADLDEYVGAIREAPTALHDSLKSWLASDRADADGTQRRSVTNLADAFRTADIPKYELPNFAEVVAYEGDLSPLDTTLFSDLLDGVFPDDADYDAILDALNAVPAPTSEYTASRISSAAATMRTDAAAHVAGLYVGPTPDGATAAITAMVSATHDAEAVFSRIEDVMFDEGYDVAVLAAQARAFAAKTSAFLRAKFQAVAAVQDYLDAYLAELKAPYTIDQKGAEVVRSVHEFDIKQIVAKAEFNSSIRSRLTEYYSSLVGYEDQATEFQKSLLKHNDWYRDALRKSTDSAATLSSKASIAGADAAARRAAAAASALGSVISSAVTSFG